MSATYPLTVSKRLAHFPPEIGWLIRDGKYLSDGNVKVWRGRGITAFMLYARYARGEDISPFLNYAQDIGANYLRVFGPVQVPPWGQEWADYSHPSPQLFNELGSFLSVLAQRGFRCEFVPLCMPMDEQTASEMLAAVYACANWNLMVEWTNEPGQGATYSNNLHHFDGIERFSVPSATGISWLLPDGISQQLIGIPHNQHFWQVHWLDYGTPHLNDTTHNRYGRVSKGLKEWRDGDVEISAEGSFCAEWNDEACRVDDTDTYPDLETHVSNTAIACLFGGASLIHFNNGKIALPPVPGGLEDQVIREASKVWAFIPPIAQTGQYTRGDWSDFPLVWTPADSTVQHAYCMWVGS